MTKSVNSFECCGFPAVQIQMLFVGIKSADKRFMMLHPANMMDKKSSNSFVIFLHQKAE